MTHEEQDMLLSQLADGELAGAEANALLLAALDDPELRQKLKEMLRLRQATAAWRDQQPSRPVMVLTAPRAARRRWFGWRLGGYAVAACLGGLLVIAGFWAAGAGRPGLVLPSTVARVTPEQMQQVARVFALHESVAGPLAWYAADDDNIRVASAEGSETGNRPVAVLLRLEPAAAGGPGAARTYVIVCRERQSATIDLPDDLPGAAGLRVYLAPKALDGRIDMQYAIAVAGQNGGGVTATLSGQRRVGLTETSLGQLALSDRLLNVQLAAWPIREPAN